jgi:hypothetical protein
MKNVSLVAAFIVLAGLSASDFTRAQDLANPQNYSGLLGTDLTKDVSPALVLEDLLMSRRKGKITGAKVLDDSERSLTLDVAYEGANFDKPKVLVAEVYGQDSQKQPMSSTDTKLTLPQGHAQITVNLQGNVPEGRTFQSRTVVVRIREDGGGGMKYDTASAFVLAKRWSVSIAPENLVVAVTPVPVGAIPATDPTATAPPPRPVIFRPDIQESIRRSVILAPVGPVPQPGRHETVRTVTPAPIEVARTVSPSTTERARTVSPATAAAVKATDLPIARIRRLPDLTIVQGLPQGVTDKGGKGPSNTVRSLFADLITAPGTQLTGAKISTISGDLYQDSNPDSGIFYYLPARYTLYWDTENGYQLRMLYGAAAGDDSGSVTISARLTSAIDANEVQLLRKLLAAALGTAFKDLLPFPFNGAPAFSLKDDVRAFNIPAEKVSVAAISDIAGEVDVSITTDTVTKENIEATLTRGLGLSGTATFTSATASGTQPFSRSVPVRLRVTDPQSFGTRYWRRNVRLRNETFFPWTLKYVHFLTIGLRGTPTVYSYSMQNTELPPSAQAQIADSAIQAWLDHSLKAWVEFSVRDNYDPGIKLAKQQWTGGVDAFTTATLSISALTPFTQPGGIARVLIDVKSKYYDPQGASEQTRSATLTKNDETVTVGPLFLVNRTTDEVARPNDPLFSYRLSIVKDDGTVIGPSSWKPGERMTVFVGSSQIAEVLEH